MENSSNWIIDRTESVLPAEFYNLVQANHDRIIRAFPITVTACADIAGTERFLLDAIEKERNNEGFHFFVRDSVSATLIGFLCIRKIDLQLMKCELAYFIDVNFEGKGIISSALGKVIEICFSELNLNKVFIRTSLDNIGSQNIALKHNFKLEGILRQEYKNGFGILEDINYYGLLKSDYHER